MVKRYLSKINFELFMGTCRESFLAGSLLYEYVCGMENKIEPLNQWSISLMRRTAYFSVIYNKDEFQRFIIVFKSINA